MNSGKNHLERILEIDKRVRTGKYPTKKYFVDYFEVSEKTIERDIDFMRYRLNAPLEYNRYQKGYFYSDEGYFLPSMSMNEGQLFSLLLTGEIIKSMGDSPIKDQVINGFKQLTDYLPQKIQIDYASALMKISIIGEKAVPIKSEVWSIILKALHKNQELYFTYKSTHSETISKVNLQPYHLVSCKGLWYIIGFNPLKNRIENYCVSRICKIEFKNGFFNIPETFDIENYIDPEMGMFISEELFNVKIRLHPWILPYFQEKRFHRTQSVKTQADGSAILTFTTNQLIQTAHWVLGWGDGVVVIEPNELRDEVIRIVNNIISHY